MSGRHWLPLILCGLEWLVAAPNFATAQVTADNSAKIVEPELLRTLLRQVSNEFSQQERIVVVGLRPVDRGYCGFIRLALTPNAFTPFFIDKATLQSEFGITVDLAMPTVTDPEPCH
jgi:hypothetical protein